VSFDGHRLDTLATDRIVRLGIAQSPEGRRIFPRMTVLENLELGAFVRADREAIRAGPRARVHALPPPARARDTEGRDAVRRRAADAGDRPRPDGAPDAAPARRAVHGPVADPRRHDFRIIQDINRQGTTILLVEQNARMALRVARRGYVIQTGRIVLQDAAAELLRSDVVRRSYLGEK